MGTLHATTSTFANNWAEAGIGSMGGTGGAPGQSVGGVPGGTDGGGSRVSGITGATAAPAAAGAAGRGGAGALGVGGAIANSATADIESSSFSGDQALGGIGGPGGGPAKGLNGEAGIDAPSVQSVPFFFVDPDPGHAANGSAGGAGADGSDGGTGGNGAGGFGGGIDTTTGASTTIAGLSFSGEKAGGGDGGDGGDAGDAGAGANGGKGGSVADFYDIEPGDGGKGGDGGNGGDGGDGGNGGAALGGAIYGDAHLNGPKPDFDDSELTGGQEGNGSETAGKGGARGTGGAGGVFATTNFPCIVPDHCDGTPPPSGVAGGPGRAGSNGIPGDDGIQGSEGNDKDVYGVLTQTPVAVDVTLAKLTSVSYGTAVNAAISVTTTSSVGVPPRGDRVVITATQGGATKATCTATLPGTADDYAACSLPGTLTVGTYSVTATLQGAGSAGGDAGYVATTSTPTDLVVVAVPTSTALTQLAPATVGSPAPVGVTVSSAAGPTPGGQPVTITAAQGGVTRATCTATLGTDTRATGTCNLPSTLALGDYTVTATYAGDVDFTGSSTTGTLTITNRTTISATVPDATVYTGVSVTYSATVAATSGTPTGTVSFSASNGGSNVVLCSTTALAVGKASCASSAAPLGADTITATFVGTGGQAPSRGTTTLTVQIAPPVAPAGATTSNSATGVDPNGKETASVTGFSATGLGVGAFTAARYDSNPTGTALSSGTGHFFDAKIASGSQLASLTLTDCDLGAGGNFLSWYDGKHWQAFSEQTKDSPNPGCITAVVDGTTSPTLAQLTGTVIGASDKPTGDFALSLDPASQILSENSSVLYSVQATTSSGFTDPVTLTIGDLPTGVTGFFVGSGSNHTTVTPGTPTQLYLSAGQSFTTGTYGFTITGTGAGLTHSVDGSVKLSFGLVPKCYAEVVGSVTDSVTGDPVSEAQVNVGFTTSVTTDEHGHYDTGMTVELGQNLSSQQVNEGVTSFSYYGGTAQPYIGCGLVTTQNVTLTKRQFGSIAGHAYVGVPDPSDPTSYAKVIPTSTPITQHVAVRLDGGNTGVPLAQVDGHGRYEIDGVSLAAPDNSPANHSVDLVDGSSYWVGPTQEVQVSAGRQAVQDLVAVPVCTGTIEVHAYSSDTGRVEVGANVSTGDPTGAGDYATTDAQGNATLTVALGSLNSPGSYDVSVVSSDGAGSTAPIRVNLSGCGAAADVQAPVHLPVANYGNITTTVLDASTQQPLQGANVQAFCQTGGAQSTDVHGVATVNHLQVGTDSETSASCGVIVGVDGYYDGSAAVAVFADKTATVTVLLTPRLPGVLSGTVTDADTGKPVAGALVDAGDVETTTDDTGRYAISSNLLLSSIVPNGPNTIDVSAHSTDGTYLPSASKKVTITAGTPAVVDLTLIPQCGVATVTGAVYNATNEQPIPNAEVLDRPGDSVAYTDANGAFALQAKVYGNTPFTDQLEAAAAGFFPAYDNVTLFCGAHVVANFGQNATKTGAVSGTVTDKATGHPVAGAFVGASWGATTTTADDGSYSFTGVPLGNDNAAQKWTVTVQPPSGSTLQPTVVPVTVPAAPPTTTLDIALGTTPPPTVTAIDHTYNTPSKTTTLTVPAPGLLAGDGGTDLVVTASEPTNNGGLVTTAPDGSFVFTPNASDDEGNTGTFTYTVTDAYGTNATGTVTVDIGTTTPAPIANADSATTAFEAPLTVADPGVLANDTGTGLHVTAHTDPAHGTVSIAGTGGYTYTPAGGYAGADSFGYTVTDSSGRTASATVSITVSAPPKPVAASYQESTAFQTPLVVAAADGVLSNSTGTRLTVTGHTAPGHGTVDVTSTGGYTYTPASGFSGDDSFTYTVTDAVGATATGTVTIAVGTGLPPAPVAHADSGITAFETPLVVAAPGLLGNDTGTGITVTGHTDPGHGTVTTTADGGYTYTPSGGYAGPDAFTYTITDSADRTSTATVSITVAPPPKPVAAAYDESTAYQTALDVDATHGLLSRSTGTRITLTGHTTPGHGTVDVKDTGAYTYTPAVSFSGDDSFGYTITDAAGATATGFVSITVSPRGLPPAPLAAADTYTTPYATTLTVAAPGVLGNDTGSAPVTVTSHIDPSHGTLDLASDGGLTYMPADGFSGPDTFTYTIIDSTGRISTAQVTITVGAKPQPVVPAITDVSPSHGPEAGGDLLTVTGTGFTDATSVTIGPTVLAQTATLSARRTPTRRALTPLFAVVSDTEITLVDPPGTGTVNVRVTTPGGTSPIVAADRFTYDPPTTQPSGSTSPVSGPTTSPAGPTTSPAGPTTSPAGPTSGSTTPVGGPTAVRPTSGPTSGGGGTLASTGFDVATLLGLGGLLVLAGAFLLRRGRRPRHLKQH